MRRKRKILAVALIIMLSFNAFSQNVGINPNYSKRFGKKVVICYL